MGLDSSEGVTLRRVARDIPLTRIAIAMSLASYALFLTDVPRSGYGYSSLPPSYVPLAPSFNTYYGPYSYEVVRIYRNAKGMSANSPMHGLSQTRPN